jgi:hypothetical protein
MLKRLLRSRMFAALIGATVVAVVGGGIGWAAIPDSSGVIHGCYAKWNGALRAIDAGNGQTCAKAEVPLNWNQTGAPGSFATTSTSLVSSFTPVQGQTTQAFAHCPSGTKVISGGYVYGHNYAFRIPIDRPGLDKTSWEVWIYADDPSAYGDGGIEVWALCG